MNVQVNTVKSGDTVYKYCRLVKAFRRADGKPAVKVITNLGQQSDQFVRNLKEAFQASKQGIDVVMKGKQDFVALPVESSYTFLNVAVALAAIDEMGLSELLEQNLPEAKEGMGVEMADVIKALIIHRLIEPGAKILAVDWFEKTALPELMDIAPAKFNNTRLHRALDALADATEQLQQDFARLHHTNSKEFRAFFIDVTDTYFEGEGSGLAERGKTKEGLNRMKFGIALLCDELGMPMRWEMVAGSTSDHDAMGLLVESAQREAWMRDTPLVFDRAMGHGAMLSRLLHLEKPFLTAVPRNQIDSHEVEIPYQNFLLYSPMCQLHPRYTDTKEEYEEAKKRYQYDLKQLREQALTEGMSRRSKNSYCIDLGDGLQPITPTEMVWVGPDDIDPSTLVGAASALAWARIFKRALDFKIVKNQAEIAKLTGVSRAKITNLMYTLKLAPELQEKLLAGEYGHLSEYSTKAVFKLETAEEQHAALLELARSPKSAKRVLKPRKLRITQTRKLRRVATFNPEIFLDMRLKDLKRRRAFETFVEELNQRLVNPRSRLTEERLRDKVRDELRDLRLLSLYSFTLEEVEEEEQRQRPLLQVKIKFDRKAWERKIKYYGFSMLVGEGSMTQDASEMIQLYSDKDTVERDFKTLKSSVKLRPVYHHTDKKVKAHVTLCMQALAVSRYLESRLSAAGYPMSAAKCFAELKANTIHRFAPTRLLKLPYGMDEPDKAQRSILQALGLENLGRTETLQNRITQRPKGRKKR